MADDDSMHDQNSQRTDCRQHQHFYRNGNDDLLCIRWKRWQSRRVLHVSRHGVCQCVTSIYCRRRRTHFT